MPGQGHQHHFGTEGYKPRFYVNQSLFLEVIKKSSAFDNERCRVCNVEFDDQDKMQQHLAEETHIVKNSYHTRSENLLKIIDGLQFKVNESEANGFREDELGRLNMTLREHETKQISLLLLNESPNSFRLNKFFKIFDLPNVEIPQADKDIELQILPGGQIEVTLQVLQGIGAYLIPLVFKIKTGDEEDETSKNSKLLLKEVIFRAQTELMDKLAPEKKYKPPLTNIAKEMEEPIIPYNRKRSSKRDKGYLRIIRVKNYLIPGGLKYLVGKVQMSKKDLPSNDKAKWSEILALLNAPLNETNYAKRFSLLLHLEELQAEYEMLQYAMNGVTLTETNSGLYELAVPGLAEKRPSVLRGDSVYIRIQKHKNFRYESFVKEVLQTSILMDLHSRFRETYRSGMKVDVRFTLNRLPLKFYHRAIELLGNSGATSLMFPSEDDSYPSQTRTLKPWRFQKMVNNREQQEAVQQIVNKSAMPAPYLLFGPPGTGKTVTIVEAIAQVWLLNESDPEKQLVCAPTNSTADLLTVGLIQAIPKAKLLRIYAVSFDVKLMNKNIPLRCTNITGNVVEAVDVKNLEEYDIVIVTLVTAGRLQGMKSGHFSYVYVDECGQALEPEAMIPVAGILTTNQRKGNVSGQLVLAGDPKQLGPVLRSALTKTHGLELSLLERLMNTNHLYQKHPETKKYNSKYLTKLVQNFRSHDQILTLPNKMFYDNDLQVKGDTAVILRGIGWSELPNSNFPVIFHGIEGMDERECSSPSYFNRQEIDQVIKYIKKLFEKGLRGKKVNENDIGVISPYRKQVQKFSKAFRLLGWTKVKVGTTEQFQGDERLVIIISTVRSNQDQIDTDLKFRLGFLKNPKRFNVAVTRAKALLIMVGNPNVLCHDSHWLGFMNFVRSNGGAKGVPWKDA